MLGEERRDEGGPKEPYGPPTRQAALRIKESQVLAQGLRVAKRQVGDHRWHHGALGIRRRQGYYGRGTRGRGGKGIERVVQLHADEAVCGAGVKCYAVYGRDRSS